MLETHSNFNQLKVLPYELKFRDPSPASIQAVSLAAKDSGDFASLSAVDLQVSFLPAQLKSDTNPIFGDRCWLWHMKLQRKTIPTKIYASVWKILPWKLWLEKVTVWIIGTIVNYLIKNISKIMFFVEK